MLEVKNVQKSFTGARALAGVDLRLPAGQTHILLGSSGSGKSTLLRAMLGLISLDTGEILFNGAPLAISRTGYVPQGGGLFPHLNVFDNASLGARAQGWSAARIETRFQELAPLFALDPSFRKRKPRHLSGGQKQRVALLRAAFTDPDLLLLDEPLSALDPLVRASLQEELRDIFSRLGKTVVFVTHDLGEAAYLGDRIVLLHEGRVVQEGRLADLRDRPATAFVTRFLHAQRIFERGEA